MNSKPKYFNMIIMAIVLMVSSGYAQTPEQALIDDLKIIKDKYENAKGSVFYKGKSEYIEIKKSEILEETVGNYQITGSATTIQLINDVDNIVKIPSGNITFIINNPETDRLALIKLFKGRNGTILADYGEILGYSSFQFFKFNNCKYDWSPLNVVAYIEEEQSNAIKISTVINKPGVYVLVEQTLGAGNNKFPVTSFGGYPFSVHSFSSDERDSEEKIIEITRSNSPVWFAPCDGSIIHAKSERPPAGKYVFWIEPGDPEFDQTSGYCNGCGIKYIATGSTYFNNTKITTDEGFEEDLTRAGPLESNAVFFIRIRDCDCLIQIIEWRQNDDYLKFQWKKI